MLISSVTPSKKELRRIKKQNHAIDNEACETGLRCVTIPVRNYTGEIIAGLSVTGPAVRIPFRKIKSNLPHLFEASQQLSLLLGYNETEYLPCPQNQSQLIAHAGLLFRGKPWTPDGK
jgi:DNA-binding IclR family transcriptional regulator